MKKINNKIKSIFTIVIASIFMLITSCEGTDLDVNVNPNALSPESADPSLVLNSIQISLVNQNFNLHANARGVMRHVNMFGTYAANSGPGSMNGAWATAYSVTANTQLISELNETLELSNHLGVAQLIEAYQYVNLVDFIGTAVYSEAVNPNIAAPNLDNGEDIYNAIYAKLDAAIANLQVPDQVLFEDLFFEGDVSTRLSQWIKVANTLKLRMYVQSKLAGNPNASAAINSIVASGNYINGASDDFQASFGTLNDNPDVRHPEYISVYDGGAGGVYMSNEFINILLNDKTLEDPRLKHYIYRQSLTVPSGNLLPCTGNTSFPLCYVGDFYWGRQHADDEGIPNDGNLRSTFGAYPAGGAFDTGSNNGTTANNVGLGGAGIFPMMTASFTDFLLAEASLPSPAGLGVSGSTISYLENAIRKSFTKVSSVSGVAMVEADVNDYVSEVLTNYNNATADEDRLSIIMKEFYIASWGNSTEAYNAYRRTGYPNLGGSVVANTDFPRNFLIPESELNTNENPDLDQITRTTTVFWDTNPAGFVE
jgi:hypothetical protein